MQLKIHYLTYSELLFLHAFFESSGGKSVVRNDSLVLSVSLENEERAHGCRGMTWLSEEPQEHEDVDINSKGCEQGGPEQRLIV